MTESRALEDVIERMRSRFYGKYRGIVTDVDATTMRVKATVPSVLGTTTSGWCLPCLPYTGPNVGFAFLPEVGSGVWVEFEGGDVSYPIWVGGYWNQGEVPSDAAGDVKVLMTASQIELKFDDSQESLTITDANGNTVTLDSSGVTASNGSSTVALSSSSVSINDGALEVQ
jgi:uncharacterized protein involved in type VI secretion and phage assembly